MSWRQQLQCALDVAEALEWLHSHGVAHGNLSPANILLCAPVRVMGTKEENELHISRCHSAFKDVDVNSNGMITLKQLLTFVVELGHDEFNLEAIRERATFICGAHKAKFSCSEAVAVYEDLAYADRLFRAKLGDPWLIRACLHSTHSAKAKPAPTSKKLSLSGFVTRKRGGSKFGGLKGRLKNFIKHHSSQGSGMLSHMNKKCTSSQLSSGKSAHPAMSTANHDKLAHWKDFRVERYRAELKWLHGAGKPGALAESSKSHLQRVKQTRSEFGWVPPEYFVAPAPGGFMPLSPAGDIFVFGAIMQALIQKHARVEKKKMKRKASVYKALRGRATVALTRGFHESDLKKLMSRCVRPYPQDRPTAVLLRRRMVSLADMWEKKELKKTAAKLQAANKVINSMASKTSKVHDSNTADWFESKGGPPAAGASVEATQAQARLALKRASRATSA